MNVQKKITILNKKGIHARTAVMIVSHANSIKNVKKVQFYIQKEDTQAKVPLTSMLALTSLGIRRGDVVIVSAVGENAHDAISELESYFTGEIDLKINNIEEFDEVLEETAININSELESIKEIKNKFGQILDHISDGICLMDDKGRITYINRAYEKIFNISAADIVGKNVLEIYPNRPSIETLKLRKNVLDVILKEVDGKEIVLNSTPVFANKVFKGVLSTYKDITDIQEMVYNLEKAKAKLEYYQDRLEKIENSTQVFNNIIGRSTSLRDLIDIAAKAAKTSATVIIRGESGTGKELIAKAIHDASKRSKEAFIKVNCAAIPENLLESELFGYEKGAFTGANKRKIGKFELANGGTLFLDEIGEINYNLQAKLLRAIQEKEIERLGSEQVIKVDIRIITATNRNLEDMVRELTFREDLYYRLNVIPIIVPPLRQRKEDIPMLVEHFLEKICRHEDIEKKRISKTTLNYLEQYNWPGNIRELENIIIRGIALSEGKYIQLDSIPPYIAPQSQDMNESLINLRDDNVAYLEEYDKAIIKAALEKHKTFNKAAKALGITHRTVSLKAKKYGLIES